MSDNRTIDYVKRLPVAERRDVVVCGGGPAGIGAALSAARAGLSVLLVERQGQLGGMATSGLISLLLGGRRQDGSWAVGGIFREIAQECRERGVALIPQPEPGMRYSPHGWYLGLHVGIPLDPDGLARYLDAKLADAGADVLLLTQAVEAVRQGGRLSHVVLLNKSGLSAVECGAVVDATGDADIAARAGCPSEKGRDEDGAMTPVTLAAHVDNVDQDALSDYVHAHDAPRLRALIRELREEGEWPFDTEIFISVQLVEKGVMLLNTTRLCGIDGTDGRSVTRGMQRGRAEIEALLDVARRRFPGFAHARLKAVAPMLGVRETRRIRGEARLSVADVQRGRAFPDTVGFSAYGWDLPDPKAPSRQPMEGRPVPPLVPLPYGIMVPRGTDNLVCPGRAVSVERDVLGPVRVMAPVMAMGQAAGLAARQVVRDGVPFRAADTDRLRTELRNAGALLDP